MPESIILSFEGDPSGLKPVADALLALGQLTKDQQTAFAKANDDFKAKMLQNAAATKQTTTALGQMSTAVKGIGQTLGGAAIKDGTENVKKFGNELVQTVAKSTSLKAQLKALKAELAGIDDIGSPAFQKLATEAAKLEDRIGDVNERIRVMAKDTFVFDAMVGAVRGVAAGFAVAQGAAALFGKENEDVQKAMLKVQAAMSIMMGVQELANIVTGQGAAKLGVMSAATWVYNAAVGATTGALKVFRIALLGTGIGAVIFLLYEGAKAFGLFSDAADTDTEAVKNNSAALEENAEIRARQIEQSAATAIQFSMGADGLAEFTEQVKVMGEEVLQATKSQLELLIVEQQRNLRGEKNIAFQKVFNDYISEYKKRLALVNDELESYVLKSDKAADKTKDFAKEVSSVPTEMLENMMEGQRQQIEREEKARKEKLAAEKELGKAIVDNEKEVNDAIAKANAEADADELKEAQRLADQKKAIQQATIEATGIMVDAIFQIQAQNDQALFDSQMSHLNDAMETELNNTNLTEDQKNAIREKYRKQEAALKTEQFKREKQAAIVQAIINTALAVVKALPNYINAALAAVAGAAQIAVISSQPVPQFAKGTEYVEGAGTGTSDSISARLSKGERVVDAATNARLRGIPNDMLPKLAEYANMIPQLEMMQQFERNQSSTFDYDKFGDKVAEKLARNPMLSVSIDRNGVNLLLTKGNMKVNYLNAKYKG